jgi:hypothetical protein
MPILPVVSKSDLDELGDGHLPRYRTLRMLYGEELDLDELARGHSSSIRDFVVLYGKESDLAELASNASNNRFFAMLYSGLFIGFLIPTILIDMPTNRYKLFLAGTIMFGAVALWCWVRWWMAVKAEKTKLKNLLKRMRKWPTEGETVFG